MDRKRNRLAVVLALALASGGADRVAAGMYERSELPGPAVPSSASSMTVLAASAPIEGPARLIAAKRKAKKSVKKRPGKKTRSEASAAPAAGAAPASTPSKGASAQPPAATPSPSPAAAATPVAAPVLDLSDVQTDSETAKQELLQATPEATSEDKKDKKGKKGKKEAGFDFGGGVEIDFGGGDQVDFGSELGGFDIQLNISSEERQRVEKAMDMMSDEDYAAAALEFAFFLQEPKFAEFKPESEYQLAKALYKLGFVEGALKRFKAILEQGSSHARYKKSVEWLFFISRKVADETPVLAELARFRNVTFPKAYRNEYRYLLSKYLFVQAQRFEVERLQQEQLARGKKSTQGLDFSALEQAAAEGGGFDFSKAGFDIGGGGGSDSGGFDFGGGGGSGGGGFDFGGGGGSGGGGFDFGGGTQSKPAEGGPVRGAAPTTAQEAIGQGLDFVAQVESESKFYPRAKYLEGLLYYLRGEDQKAVEAFREVVRVLNPRVGVRLDPKLREMAFLSLARIHYGYKQFDKSVFYYDQIDRDSESWLTALFEASWAYYRRGDFEKALGNLLTLHSPFFEREYFPESQLVKAIIYFEACRYGETRGILDTFIKRFTAVMKAVEKIAQSQEAPELLYERIAQLQKDAAAAQDDVTARVVSLALADLDIRTARDVVQQVQDQLELARQMPEGFRQSRLAGTLNEELKELLAARSREAGEVTRRKFENELYQLKGLLAQALRIKIEVARAERESIERKMRNEAGGDELVPATARTVVDDEHVYWPYEGEYWRDELGTYELDFAMCRPLATGT